MLIFIIYHSLNKFKRNLIPPIQELFKKIDDNEIYTLLESLIPSLNYSKEMIVNNSKNIFLIKTIADKINTINPKVRLDIVKKNKNRRNKIFCKFFDF